MIKSDIVKEAYDKLLQTHTVEDSNLIMLNCLAILGDKKVIVSKTLDEKALARVNRYKYPDRLASFINITNNKSKQWADLSFAKIAFN